MQKGVTENVKIERGDDMGWLNNMNDVVLDDAAFEKAIADFSDLAVQPESAR